MLLSLSLRGMQKLALFHMEKWPFSASSLLIFRVIFRIILCHYIALWLFNGIKSSKKVQFVLGWWRGGIVFCQSLPYLT